MLLKFVFLFSQMAIFAYFVIGPTYCHKFRMSKPDILRATFSKKQADPVMCSFWVSYVN